MRSRSNISASLYKKRRASLRKKIFTCFVFVLFFISLAILGLTEDKVRIKNVVISGNFSVPAFDITKIANDEMNKYYLWIIPANNIFLLRGKEIKNDILDKIKKIASVKILIRGIDKIEIIVKEREAKNMWCMDDLVIPKKCYFMDSNGFIFEEAPQFSGGAFPEFFGLITEGDPIGQFYFKNNFSAQNGSALSGKNISKLFNSLTNMSFQPKYFNALSEHEYEVYILGGGKILINDKKDFESSLINLQALISNGYIKNDAESLKKIKYVDLRFGNKVNFELVK